MSIWSSILHMPRPTHCDHYGEPDGDHLDEWCCWVDVAIVPGVGRIRVAIGSRRRVYVTPDEAEAIISALQRAVERERGNVDTEPDDDEPTPYVAALLRDYRRRPSAPPGVSPHAVEWPR